MLQDLFNAVCRVVRRRPMFFIVVGSAAMLALFAWNIASGISSFENATSKVSIAPVVGDTFLGVQVSDHTHDQYLSNAKLRLAMNEAFKACDSVRRYQMGMIWLQDGQHPDTGRPAVLVTVEPTRHELPSPPFEPVAVRRWEPDPNEEYDLDELPQMRLVNSPNEEDLDRLRQVWSGGKVGKVDSLYGSFRWLFAFAVIGMALMVVAGAYRANAWRSSRWDRAADVKREDAALSRLQSARDAKQS